MHSSLLLVHLFITAILYPVLYGVRSHRARFVNIYETLARILLNVDDEFLKA